MCPMQQILNPEDPRPHQPINPQKPIAPKPIPLIAITVYDH
jgi:hypothetical protein